MLYTCPGLPAPAVSLPEVIRSMAHDDLPPAEIRRRLHLLFPDEPPRAFERMLRRQDFTPEPTAGPWPSLEPTDHHIRIGVEVIAALAADLQPRPESALTLETAVHTAVEALTVEFDPSGHTLRQSLGLIAALRDRIEAGAAPELSKSTYRRVLQDIALAADLPPQVLLSWPVSAQVVAERLGGGDWHQALAAVGLAGAPGTEGPHTAADDVLELDDPGIGLVAAPEPQDEQPEHVWDELRDRLAADLAVVPWRGVLVLRYIPLPGMPWPPVAWARTGPDGARTSLSGIGSSSTTWPWERSYFDEGHWRAPTDQGSTWNAGPLDFTAAAERMVEGLRFGRSCNDPYRYRWGADDSAQDPHDGDETTGAEQPTGMEATVVPLAPHAP